MVITVDCSDIKPLQHDLLVHVADAVGALPVLKSGGFALSPIEDDKKLNPINIIGAITDFLESVDLSKDFETSSDGNSIMIISVSDKALTAKTQEPSELFFECTHCGYVTAYEEDLRTHGLIHYI